ncbi:hypothetical protein D1605_011115 [Xylella fastidiosa subsp. fastidiosa]|jgi:hypothetical protein|uniref:Uncharacterized protein n=2 Tax=Xylella fastidiosa TaxID=2371 RepID=B2IAN4_XYLF2|nr:hypothetical protein [Xylella fastidiosa]ACB93584.1 conserved hypothetical protein [Xylella fastidiosa M23]EGO82876.1 hypothetical protein XFEB_00208 [Xylella fastidiosa EB92.1]KAF0571551.1 hypothetical protein P305_03925 [Xylella fastidiosa subsp. fastidiosa Mus-1]KQH74717.1 hypothetical protein AOT81_00110 [Xylella fastidiosa]MBE0261486.1 hypothetical protein [Xylella fastidiosa subsp. fastidiosa]
MLPDGDARSVRFRDAQSNVFELLGSFKGEAMTVDRIMQHAGLDSIKPSDLLKTKGLPESQDAAYGALVVMLQRVALSRMRCRVR